MDSLTRNWEWDDGWLPRITPPNTQGTASRTLWHTLIPAHGRQRQVDLYELKASLVYRANSRLVKAT